MMSMYDLEKKKKKHFEMSGLKCFSDLSLRQVLLFQEVLLFKWGLIFTSGKADLPFKRVRKKGGGGRETEWKGNDSDL